MNRNSKYRGSVKYKWGSFSGFPWISCINYVCTRGSWFSHLKTIYNLSVFVFIPSLYFFHELECQYWGSVKYSNGVLFFGLPRICCINSICTRGAWFSHLKTTYNLCVFLFSLLHISFRSWNAKYQGSVKYNNGVLFLDSLGLVA